jgi:hypothetical protein
MDDKPNPADFSVDERPREYKISLRIEGEIVRTIKADSVEQAREIAEAMADKIADGQGEAELDEVYDVLVSDAYKTKPMYLVTRDGQAMKVTYLRPGDIPRQPDERGF